MTELNPEFKGFKVVYLRNGKVQSVAFRNRTMSEAEEIAAALNQGLQPKAVTMGFSYEVRSENE